MRRVAWVLLLAVGCTGYSHPSVDEPEVEDEPEAAVTEDPERWDAVTDAWTDPADPDEEARARFMAGSKAFRLGDYATALTEFEAAYELQPVGAIRFNIAVCLEKLGRSDEARAELDALANDATQAANLRRQAAEKRDALTTASTPAADMAVAERVVARIVDLRHRHPRLRGLSMDDVTRWEDGRGLDLKLSRGVHYRDNPDCGPTQKCSRLSDFDRDGVEIYVYLSLDPWQGTAAVLPRRIGSLYLVAFIDGPDNAGMQRVRDDIEKILTDAGG
jgi:tetratricopeptide (TPR) repeat protein